MGGGLDTGTRLALASLAWAMGVAAQLQRADTLPPGHALASAACALLGFFLTEWRTAQSLADRLEPALEGRDLVVTGVIDELPRLSPTGTMFTFSVKSATLEGAPVRVTQRLSLGWLTGFDGEQLVASPPKTVTAGERWGLTVRLKRPHGPRNPHVFDLELWLFERGVRASGTVRAGAQPLRPNALSCVLHVQDAQGRALLLTGDLEAPQELALVERAPEALRADVLQVPHHGSRTSSTPAFLDAVSPRLAFVQAGYRNRYGHPVREVLARYEARGIAPVRSDQCGAWRWRPGETGRCLRYEARRYWHHWP